MNAHNHGRSCKQRLDHLDREVWKRLRRLYLIIRWGASKRLVKKRTGNPIRDFLSSASYEVFRFLDHVDTAIWFRDRPVQTLSGRVKSQGEKDIANWLYRHDIRFIYEPAVTIADLTVRPDFYLPDYGLYLEFWGPAATNQRYRQMMDKKLEAYHRHGVEVISIYPKDLRKLDEVLARLLVSVE